MTKPELVRLHTKMEEIKTNHIYPPIPIRNYDWIAYYDEEGACGYGRTEEEAIENLTDTLRGTYN